MLYTEIKHFNLDFEKNIFKVKATPKYKPKKRVTMAKEGKKPKPLFSPGQREKGNIETLQCLQNVLKEDGDFTIFYGKLHDKQSYYVIGFMNNQYYSYRVDAVCRFESLKARFEGRGGRFKKNLATNPFKWWEELSSNLGIPDYEARPDGEFYYGGFRGRSYRASTKKGNLLDFAKGLGVYIRGYMW